MTDPTPPERIVIQRLRTPVDGLDEVLGGGIPEFSFNLIAGTPGTGKTTLAHQIMFAHATEERPALHFTVLGEPTFKMLRYQQQFSFFDLDAVGRRVHFVNLSEQALEQDLDLLLATIVENVERYDPAIVVVDSFRTIARAVEQANANPAAALQSFLQRLALRLATWQTTSFLVGEYSSQEVDSNPVFTIADGIIWLHQDIDRNSVVRKLHVMKLRGQAPLPGLHTMRITNDGIEVFPRIIKRDLPEAGPRPRGRLSVGSAELDEMLGGGIPASDAVLVTGPAGSGKSTLGTGFIRAGLEKGEPAVIAVFEERPEEYVERAKSPARGFSEYVDDGLLEMLYPRPLDLSVDEALLEIEAAVRRTSATRLLIDSLSGFELALAPTFRDDFRESLYRMVKALTGSGITTFMTAEVRSSFRDLEFSPNLVSFLTDDIIVQRYVEVDGQLRRMLAVIKMRGSQHTPRLRFYELTPSGIELTDTPVGFHGLTTGVAKPG